MLFPVVANQPVLSFRYYKNDPITYTNFQHIKEARNRAALSRVRPDERACCTKVWDWFCLGVEYNGVTKEVDLLLWRLMHAPEDPLALFEEVRDKVRHADRHKFVYLSLDRDTVRFSLNHVDDLPIHFTATPQGVPSRITANLRQPTFQEQLPEAQAGQSNLHELVIYQNASRHVRAMLDKLARPATFMAICRARDLHWPEDNSAGMADAGMPGAGPRDPLLTVAQQYPPTFILSELANGLTRADVRYSDGLGRRSVSFLICEPAHAGIPDEDTLQCIYTKYTPTLV